MCVSHRNAVSLLVLGLHSLHVEDLAVPEPPVVHVGDTERLTLPQKVLPLSQELVLQRNGEAGLR